jgi:pyocin large subunit-like protein
MRKISFLKLVAVFVFLLGLVFLSASCSQDKAPATSSMVQARTAWAKDFASGQLEAHYLKHKYEFGDISSEEYLNGAKILLNSAPSQDILEKTRDNGDVLHYRISTGEFAVMAGDGRIRTYFRTDYSYWLRQ